MLAGPGAKGQLPKEVTQLKVDCTANVLFFLHTFNTSGQWRPAKPTDSGPVVLKYVVHYADGQKAEIPVRLHDGIDHWIVRNPAGLRNAAVAWSARFPGDSSEEEAVVYQFSWINPHPEQVIQSIDMSYGPEGEKFGAPVLLAVTAGVTP